MSPEQNSLWQILTVRATAFLKVETPDPSEVWKRFVGNDPNSVIEKVKNRIKVIDGEFDGKRLIYQRGPGRVDWQILPLEMLPDEEVKTLGQFPDGMEQFKDLLKRWLDDLPGVNRLAFAPKLVIQTDGLAAGYRFIQKYLPSIKLDPDKTDDFLFRINRKRDFNYEGKSIVINRLCSWQIMNVDLGHVQYNGDAISSANSYYSICMLDLDLNNLPLANIEASKTLKQSLFETLIEYAVEIANRGDVE